MCAKLLRTALVSVVLAVACSGASMAATISVKDSPYNAQGDGSTDDTAAIQAALTAAYNAGEACTVNFPEGTYIVSTVQVRINSYPITIQTTPGVARAVIKLKAGSNTWQRNFTTSQYPYSGAGDSAKLKFTNLEFDGNLANQGDYQNYELEHQAAIFAMAAQGSAGRLVLEVSDCEFHDGAADAIALHYNVDATISNITTQNYFRGGVTSTGGGADVQVTDWTATAGESNYKALDIEIDAAGYGGSYASDYSFTDCSLSSFDVGFYGAEGGGGSFTGENITVTGNCFLMYVPEATVRISNSTFYAGLPDTTHIYTPHDVIFDSCTFYATHTTGATFAPVRVFANTGSGSRTNQTCLFQDCAFELDDSIEEGDTTYAVWVNADRSERNNLVSVVGGTIATGYTYGIYWAQGGTGNVEDVTIDADTALHWGASSSPYFLTATANNVHFGTNVTTSEYLILYYSGNSLTHTDVFLDSDVNTIGSYYGGSGMVSATYSGARYVTGDVNPTSASTPGFTGDIYQIDPLPGENQTCQWECTSGHKTAATWVAHDTMPCADANLVGNWRFDEMDAAGSTARDSSGNGYSGTIANGPTRVKGKVWRGLLCDGHDDLVDMGDQSAFDFASDTQFSLAAWFKWDGASQTWQPIIQKGNLNSSNYYYLGIKYGAIQFLLKDGNGNYKAISGGNATSDVWTHIVAVKDGTKVYIYVNGSKVTDSTHSFTGGFSSSYPLRVGFLSYITPPTYVNYGFHGIIDSVRVYNRALDSTEVADLYAEEGGT